MYYEDAIKLVGEKVILNRKGSGYRPNCGTLVEVHKTFAMVKPGMGHKKLEKYDLDDIKVWKKGMHSLKSENADLSIDLETAKKLLQIHSSIDIKYILHDKSNTFSSGSLFQIENDDLLVVGSATSRALRVKSGNAFFNSKTHKELSLMEDQVKSKELAEQIKSKRDLLEENKEFVVHVDFQVWNANSGIFIDKIEDATLFSEREAKLISESIESTGLNNRGTSIQKRTGRIEISKKEDLAKRVESQLKILKAPKESHQYIVFNSNTFVVWCGPLIRFSRDLSKCSFFDMSRGQATATRLINQGIHSISCTVGEYNELLKQIRDGKSPQLPKKKEPINVKKNKPIKTKKEKSIKEVTSDKSGKKLSNCELAKAKYLKALEDENAAYELYLEHCKATKLAKDVWKESY